MPPTARNELLADILNEVQETATAINHSRSQFCNIMWEMWQQFYIALGISEILRNIDDPVIFLQVLSRRFWYGLIYRNGESVRSRAVEEAIKFIGRMFILMGSQKSRLNSFENFNERISCQLAQ